MNGGFSEDREDDPISRTAVEIRGILRQAGMPSTYSVPEGARGEKTKRRSWTSVEERYKDHADSLGKLTHWARALVADRYLLPEDAERILGQPIFLEEKRWFEGCLKGWRLKSCRCLMGTKEKRLVMNYLGPFTFLFLRFAGHIL